MAFLILSVFFTGSARAAEETLDGVWETPLGRVRFEPADGGLVGKLVDASAKCPAFPRGAEVVRGQLADDLFTGELRSCFHPKCEIHDAWVFGMAARVGKGDALTGAITALPGCADVGYGDAAFTFTRERERPQVAPNPASTAQPISEIMKANKGTKRRLKPEVEALMHEGQEMLQSGRFDVAQRRFLKANDLDPKNPEIMNYLGVTHYARADLEGASNWYRKALAVDPGHAEAHYNLACIYAKQGQKRDALKSLHRAVESGYADVSAMRSDPDLSSLREDPEFISLRRSMEARGRH